MDESHPGIRSPKDVPDIKIVGIDVDHIESLGPGIEMYSVPVRVRPAPSTQWGDAFLGHWVQVLRESGMGYFSGTDARVKGDTVWLSAIAFKDIEKVPSAFARAVQETTEELRTALRQTAENKAEEERRLREFKERAREVAERTNFIE